MLEALAELEDEGRVRAALATALLGYGAAELDRLGRDEMRTFLERFNEIQRKTVDAKISFWSTGRDDTRIEGYVADMDELLTRATRAAVSDLYDNVRPVKFTTLMLTLLTEMADYVREIERAHSLWDNYIKLEESEDPKGAPGQQPLPDVT